MSIFNKSNSLRPLLFAAFWGMLFLLSGGCQHAAPVAPAKAEIQAASDFITLFPNQFTDREKPLVDKFLAEMKAIEARGQVAVQALVRGKLPKETPGIGAVLVASEDMVRYDNHKYDPENPVLNVAAYAKKLGYQNILAYPTFAANDDAIMKPFPTEARDKLLVSDLNHNITFYKPVYPGDTLFTVINKRQMIDLTPKEGAERRSVAIESQASIYNQKGEKVNDATFRVTESVAIYQEGKKPADDGGFMPFWVFPNWENRPAHFYADEDWARIKDLWSKEKRQGATPLYWEDVQIGDEPAWTVDGPVLASVNPTMPFGMGSGGSRTLKKEIKNPAIFKTMIRDEKTGIYKMPNEADNIPAVPEHPYKNMMPGPPPPADKKPSGEIKTSELHKEVENKRAILVNFMGRDFAVRHLQNFMGDKGWLQNLRWSIMDSTAHAAVGLTVPRSPLSEHYIQRVPALKGKVVSTHGMTGDLVVVKSYVYDKSERNGEHFVDLIWWIETIDGDIWEEGGATIRLPSKGGK